MLSMRNGLLGAIAMAYEWVDWAAVEGRIGPLVA